jgi:hypothetical protein
MRDARGNHRDVKLQAGRHGAPSGQTRDVAYEAKKTGATRDTVKAAVKTVRNSRAALR